MIDWLQRAPTEKVIALNGVEVPIVLRRHRTARRLTLRLSPDGGEVRITLPRWAVAREAIAFAHARADWLANQHAAIPAREPVRPGGSLRYRGRTLQLEWSSNLPRSPVRERGSLRLGGPREGIEPRVRAFLEKEARRLMEADMADYTGIAGIEPVPVALSRAQKRWGSCSDKRRIRINWRLIQAPDYVRRSVVAHEVAHLVHFDHGPDFHALLADIYEGDIARADLWLRRHGRSLYSAFG